jgi:hypothetical protein
MPGSKPMSPNSSKNSSKNNSRNGPDEFDDQQIRKKSSLIRKETKVEHMFDENRRMRKN